LLLKSIRYESVLALSTHAKDGTFTPESFGQRHTPPQVIKEIQKENRMEGAGGDFRDGPLQNCNAFAVGRYIEIL
jgi:hypothetical protein